MTVNINLLIYHSYLFAMILLQSETPGGKCAKLHTVSASNNRNHVPW